MLEAAIWGAITGGSLVLGALIALEFNLSRRTVGLIMSFGAGTLISAVSYELIGEAEFHESALRVALAMLAGAGVFLGGSWCIDSLQPAAEAQASADATMSPAHASTSGGLALVLGAVLDGLPESFVMGLSILQGGGGEVALIAAVFLSNLPEGIAGTADLSHSGWQRGRILEMWGVVLAATVIATVAGYAVFDHWSGLTGTRVQAFAAGAILAMLADTMMPEAFQYGGRLAGLVTVLGFILGIALTAA